MSKIFLKIIMVFFLFTSLYSQIDSSAQLQYYPLAIGNRWDYQVISVDRNDTLHIHYEVEEIIGDTVLPNGKKYYVFKHVPPWGNTFFQRLDTATLIIYEYGEHYDDCPDSELNIFNLSITDSMGWDNCLSRYGHYNITSSNEELPVGVTGYSAVQTVYEGGFYDFNQTLSRGYGFSFGRFGDLGRDDIYVLTAANIQGHQYGNPAFDHYDFFPLEIGNKWQYEVWALREFGEFSHYATVEVIGDTIARNGKRYYIVEGFDQLDSYSTGIFRVDSTTSKVYQYISNYWDPGSSCPDSEMVYFDLNPPWVEGEYNNCMFDVRYIREFGPIEMLSIVGESILYDWFTGLTHYYTLSKGIGITGWYWGELGGVYGRQLTAARIGGINYGEFIYESDSYFPLKVGNQWAYVSQGDTLIETIVDSLLSEGSLFYQVDRFRDQATALLTHEENRVLIQGDTATYLLYDFGVQQGDSWEAHDPYSLLAGQMTLVSKTDTVITPAGTFVDCYRFHHFIGDDYEFDEWFAPEVGLVQRDVITIMGARRWTLFYTTLQVTGEWESNFPGSYSLHQNYPNPFNPVTTIRYELPTNSHVSLKIYDILGREVAVLGDREEGPGVKEVLWNASNVPSGIYFIQMIAGDFRQVRKVMVLK